MVVAALSLYLGRADQASLLSAWGLAEAVGSQLWLLFPFVAFAGGLPLAAIDRDQAVRALVVTTTALGVIAYAVGAFLVPVSELRAEAAAGFDVQARYPFGPDTPPAILAQRAEVIAAPPASYSFSVENPLQRPPNWLLYTVHQPIAFGLFGLVNAILGLMAGWVTTGLSPPKRRNTRWALGLGSAVLFYLLSLTGARWVQASPDHSAFLGAWLPVSVPVLFLLLAAWALQQRNLHGSAPLDV